MDGSMARMRTPGVSDQVKFQHATGEKQYAMEDLSGKPIEDSALELLKHDLAPSSFSFLAKC